MAKPPKPIGLFCVGCRGVRPHLIEVRIEGEQARRVAVCQVCESESEAPGISCRKCGATRFKTVFTRPRSPGVVMRDRQCARCKARWKEITRVARGQADPDPVKV